MKKLPCCLAAFFLVGSFNSVVLAQGEQRLADYLAQHPEADTNRDGKLSREEARAHRRRDPSRGDNLRSVSHVPGIEIPLDVAPLKEVALQSKDGVNLSFAWRRPNGEGPFPVIVFFHGGGGQSSLSGLKRNLITGAVQTRFLERGYLTVQSTRRPFWRTENSKSPTGFYAAVDDATLVVNQVKKLPDVDPDRVVLYGGSGGGILAIVTASKTRVARVVAGEPATVVPIDPRTGERAGPGDYRGLMDDPHPKYDAERRNEMRAWMKQIDCPVLVLQGDRVGLYRTNFEILIPELKALGCSVTSLEYPGLTHGFYWGTTKTGATVQTVDRVVQDVDRFIRSLN